MTSKLASIAFAAAFALLVAPLAALAEDSAPPADSTTQAGDAQASTSGDAQGKGDDDALNAVADAMSKCGAALALIGAAQMAQQDCKQSDD